MKWCKNWKRNICVEWKKITLNSITLDQESKPVVPNLRLDLHHEGFRGWPHVLLFYTGEDECRNHFLILRYVTEIQFWAPPPTQEGHWQTGGSSVQGDWDDWGGRTFPWEGAGRVGLVQLEMGQSWGDLTAVPSASMMAIKKMESQAFHSFAWWVDERLWAYTETGEFQTELELFLHCSQVVEEITLRLQCPS